MEASDKQKLVESIEKAWANVQYPGDQNIFTPKSYDDEGIAKYFSGTTWRGHGVAGLRSRCSAISVFFTPKAYHYWLPAYLIAAVDDPMELSQGVYSLVASVTPGKGSDLEERMALLTNEQKVAVIKVLEYLIEVYHDSASPEETKGEENALTYLFSITSVA
jgi:hypothetical protein